MSPVDAARPVPTRRLRADAARNRQALIEAAQRLFATRGMSVTLDDIAAEAGVNVATAYRHFENKRQLTEVLLVELIDRAVEDCKQAAAAPDPWLGIVGFFTNTMQLMLDNRGLRDVFTPGFAETWLKQLDERVEPFVLQMLARGQQSGCLRADLVSEDIGVMCQMLSAVVEIPSPDKATMAERYVALLVDALRPSATALPGAPPSQHDLRVATAIKKGGAPDELEVKPD